MRDWRFDSAEARCIENDLILVSTGDPPGVNLSPPAALERQGPTGGQEKCITSQSTLQPYLSDGVSEGWDDRVSCCVRLRDHAYSIK